MLITLASVRLYPSNGEGCYDYRKGFLAQSIHRPNLNFGKSILAPQSRLCLALPYQRLFLRRVLCIIVSAEKRTR